MKREFSAGGVVFKKSQEVPLYLVIKPKPSPQFPKERYQLPKGLTGPNEKPEDAAVREVQEESGITAKIISKIDYTKYVLTINQEKFFKIVTWFLMEYSSGKPTADNFETEQVLWLPFEDAKKTLTYSSEKTILKKAYLLQFNHAPTPP